MTTIDQVPFSNGRNPVTITVPTDACDSHFHIFDPTHYPYKPTDQRNQPPATVEAYRLLQQKLHLTRGVVVTPSAYGTDNACTLHAVHTLGIASTRGIITLEGDVSEAKMAAYNDQGICGVRYNFSRGAKLNLQAVFKMSEMAQHFGWSLSFWMPANMTVELESFLLQLPSKLIFDHRGHLPQPQGIEHPAWHTLQKLIDHGHTWVKLSALYHDSQQIDHGYHDTIAVGKAIVDYAPERVVWGSDWPHPSEYSAKRDFPDDAYTMDAVNQQASWNSATVRKILVDNPATLFNFN